MAENKELELAFKEGTDPQLPLSSLRLLVPPLRLMSACMWRVAQQRNVQQYGKLAEFITLVTEMVPELLTPRRTAELILGLRARLILELLQTEEQSDSQEVQEQLDSVHLLVTNGWQEELPDAEVEDSKKAFIELVQTLREKPSEKNIFFKNVFPEHYGSRFDTTLQVVVWEFLSRLEELLPVASFCEVASNFHLDSLDPHPNHFISDPEDFATLLQHRLKGLKLKKNPHAFSSRVLLSSLASRRLSLTTEDYFVEEGTAGEAARGPALREQRVAHTSVQRTPHNGDGEEEEEEEDEEEEDEEDEVKEEEEPEVIGSSRSDAHSSPPAVPLASGSPLASGPAAAARSQSCPYCGQRFSSWPDLLGHRCSVHGAVGRGFQCQRCQRQLFSQKALTRHLEAHETECDGGGGGGGGGATGPGLQCDQCPRRLGSEKALRTHLRAHENRKAAAQRAFQCDQCKRRLGSENALRKHLGTHRRSRSVVCPQCNKVLKSVHWLKTHLRLHTGERPFPCTFCGKRFKEKGVLRAHLRLHGAEYSYLCSECGKGFNHMTSLVQHNRMHSGEKPFPCSVCSRRFASSQRRHVHQLIHTGERPHACTYCDKRFRTSTSLTRHVRIHTGEKPYQCPVCDKGFQQSSNMKIHMRVHNKEKKNG